MMTLAVLCGAYMQGRSFYQIYGKFIAQEIGGIKSDFHTRRLGADC